MNQAARIVLLVFTLSSGVLAAAPTWQQAVEAHRAATPNVLPAEDAAGGVDGAFQPWGFHTDGFEPPWWQVDLGAPQPLDHAVLYCAHVPERLNGFVVELSDDGAAWRVAYLREEPTDGQSRIEVPLGGAVGRYLRVRVPQPTWMHLGEVEVYATTDATANVALGKPATQSSASQWSTAKIALPRDEAGWSVDREAATRTIDELARLAGPDGGELSRRAAALVEAATALDDPAWERLYSDARAARAKWGPVVTQWPLVSLDALERALEDLCVHFPDRYGKPRAWRDRIEGFRAGWEATRAGTEAGDTRAWETAAEIVGLQRELLLANPLLDVDRLLVIRRELGPAARRAMGAELGVGTGNFTTNEDLPRTGWDNEIATLSDLRGEAALSTLYKPDGGKIVADLDLDSTAQRLMFSSIGTAQPNWRVFEIGTGGGVPWQLTPDDGEDVGHFDSCYLPDGDIVFASTASYQGLPCVYGSSQMVCLFRRYADGRVRQLTFEQDSDWCPTLLNDGRVLYQRWEYSDLPHSNSRLLFRMNPDGTQQQEYYGSGSYFPASLFYSRPVPDDPSRIVAIATGHHGTPRSGRLLVIDPVRGQRETEGVVQEIPGYGKAVEPIVRDRLVDGVWPQFLHPWPLSSRYHLVAMKPRPDALWGIYLADVFDNLTLIREEEDAALLEPTLLAPRPAAPVIPDRVDPTRKDATVFVSDVYRGPGLAGVPRGTVKRLRVGAYYFGSRGVGGLLGSIGMDGPWDIKRILGTVPVDESGSACFRIPANTPVFVQPLDEEGKALQLMRSWFVGMPGEAIGCVGCHEAKPTVVGAVPVASATRGPVDIEPWEGHGPVHGFAFVDDVQPVLDRYCVGCHDGAPRAGGDALVDLRGDEYIRDWSSQISGNCGPSQGGNFSVSYANLHRYVRRPGIESDLRTLAPGEFHADTTELVQMLREGRHHGVRLDAAAWDSLTAWIDMNAPFHGTWADVAPVARDRVAQVNPRRGELARLYASIDVDYEATPQRVARPKPEPIVPVALSPSPAAPVLCEGWPFGADEARGRQGSEAESSLSIDLGGGLTIGLRRVPAGRFVTGGPDARLVEVEKPYWVAACEVTNEQFRRFDPAHDSRTEDRHGYQFGRLCYDMGDPRSPVVRVSWNDAQAFCEWLSAGTGRVFSLPTEDQWEYACRAGSDEAFSFGPEGTDYTPFANLGDRRLSEFAACTAQDNYTRAAVLPNPSVYDDWVPHDTAYDDGSFLTAEAAHYAPNAWGLYDMHGNVWEWTLGERAAGRKVARGGSWYWRPKWCTASSWLDYQPYQKVFDVGFRVVCEEP